MRIAKTLISVALLLMAWSATAGIPRTEAQKAIDEICAKEPLRSALVGVLAVRADGDTVVAVNHRQKLVPASNVKLLTTGMALQLLGANFRFETRLGYTGTIEDGTLHGDVYILGGGDPTTGSRSESTEAIGATFGTWAQLLFDAGIRRIEGRILGDPRYFTDHTPQNLGWTFDDLGTYYGAGPSGLNFFENAQNFYITPGASGSAVNYRVQYPETPWMHYENHTVTGAARSSNTLYYVSSTLAPVGEIAGSFPADRRGYTLECSNTFGAFTCAYFFHNFLRTQGVEVSGGWGDITHLGEIRTSLELGAACTPAPAVDSIRIAGSAWSAPLADIVADTNRESDNFYAEALLKTIAMHLGKTARQDDLDDASDAGLRKLGLRPDGACRQFDGSGLSRKNYVSPDFFVRFLRKMMALPVWNAFFDSLPVPGEKGTLENRFDKAPQEFKDRIHMKSGSMNGVRCFSGYILASDGDPKKTIVFSLLTNNCTASSYQATPILDSMIEAIAAEN
jgi:D-alanyl-D-alanine carboxypeptidase/D-alanyl-D-alanine-endopeptidase (penicillin-binding protein 4)